MAGIVREIDGQPMACRTFQRRVALNTWPVTYRVITQRVCEPAYPAPPIPVAPAYVYTRPYPPPVPVVMEPPPVYPNYRWDRRNYWNRGPYWNRPGHGRSVYRGWVDGRRVMVRAGW